MPTVPVVADHFFAELGQRLSIEKFDYLCFEYGLEFDGEEKNEEGNTVYRIEVPANRIDLLCAEGIAQALRVFLGHGTVPRLHLQPSTPNAGLKMRVKSSTSPVRPFCFCAILRNITFTPHSYKSFIDLQDKLHHNIARRRQLVAIGTHDLSTLQGPFTYEAVDPKSIRFLPLNFQTEVDGQGLMEALSTHAQLKAYLPIIRDSARYPVIRDAAGVVLSVPPIINGEHSKITLATKDVFIEVTARDRTKGAIVLNTLCAMFSRHCTPSFLVEPVLVEYDADHPNFPNGAAFVNPSIQPVTFEASTQYIQSITGIKDLSSEHICDYLKKMMLDAQPDPHNTDSVIVSCPITRSDILHQCDLAEDVAIAYGFNNIQSKEAPSVTEQPIMALSNQIRTELANCGYHETLTWGLCSLREAFEFLRRPWVDEMQPSPAEYDTQRYPVLITNPKTKEFEMVRSSLLPGLLKTVAANKAQELPLKVFEIGDCVFLDPSTETRARTVRHCAALIANNAGSGLELIHGLLDVILGKLGLVPEYLNVATAHAVGAGVLRKHRLYKLVVSNDDQAFLPGRCVKLVVEPGAVQLGIMGVLHPHVLKAYGITLPCSVFEFSLKPFLDWLQESSIFNE